MAVPEDGSHTVHVLSSWTRGQLAGGVCWEHSHAVPTTASPAQVGLSTVGQPAKQGMHTAHGARVLHDAKLVQDLHSVGTGHTIYSAQVHMASACSHTMTPFRQQICTLFLWIKKQSLFILGTKSKISLVFASYN